MNKTTETKTIETMTRMIEHLEKDLEMCNQVIKEMNDELQHLAGILDHVHEFYGMPEDERVRELINVRENLKMAEELAGIGEYDGESGSYEDPEDSAL